MYKDRIRELAQEYYNKAIESLAESDSTDRGIYDELEEIRKLLGLAEYEVLVESEDGDGADEEKADPNPFKTPEVRAFFDLLTKLRKKLKF